MNWLDKLFSTGQISKEDYEQFKSNPKVTEDSWFLYASVSPKAPTKSPNSITFRGAVKEKEYKEPEMPRAVRELQRAADNVTGSAQEVAGMILAGDIRPREAPRMFKDMLKEGFKSQASDFVAPAIDKSLKWASKKLRLPFDVRWKQDRIYGSGPDAGGQVGIDSFNNRLIVEQQEYRRRKEEEENAKRPLKID